MTDSKILTTYFNTLLRSSSVPHVPIFVGNSFKGFSTKWRGVLTNITYNPYLRNEFACMETGLKGITGSPLVEFSAWSSESLYTLYLPNTISYKFFFHKSSWKTGFLVRSAVTSEESWLNVFLNSNSILRLHSLNNLNFKLSLINSNKFLLLHYDRYNFDRNSLGLSTVFSSNLIEFYTKTSNPTFLLFSKANARIKLISYSRLLSYKTNFVSFFIFDRSRRLISWSKGGNLFEFRFLQPFILNFFFNKLVTKVNKKFTSNLTDSKFILTNGLSLNLFEFLFGLNFLVCLISNSAYYSILLEYVKDLLLTLITHFTNFLISVRIIRNDIKSYVFKTLDYFVKCHFNLFLNAILKISHKKIKPLLLKEFILNFFFRTLFKNFSISYDLFSNFSNFQKKLNYYTNYSNVLVSLATQPLVDVKGKLDLSNNFLFSYIRNFKRYRGNNVKSPYFDLKFKYKKLKKIFLSKLRLPLYTRQFFFLFFWSFNFFNFYTYTRYDFDFMTVSTLLVKFFVFFKKFLNFYNFIFSTLYSFFFNNYRTSVRFLSRFAGNFNLYVWRLNKLFFSLSLIFRSMALKSFYVYWIKLNQGLPILNKKNSFFDNGLQVELNEHKPISGLPTNSYTFNWKPNLISFDLMASKRYVFTKFLTSGGKNFYKGIFSFLFKKFNFLRYLKFLSKLKNNFNLFKKKQFLLSKTPRMAPQKWIQVTSFYNKANYSKGIDNALGYMFYYVRQLAFLFSLKIFRFSPIIKKRLDIFRRRLKFLAKAKVFLIKKKLFRKLKIFKKRSKLTPRNFHKKRFLFHAISRKLNIFIKKFFDFEEFDLSTFLKRKHTSVFLNNIKPRFINNIYSGSCLTLKRSRFKLKKILSNYNYLLFLKNNSLYFQLPKTEIYLFQTLLKLIFKKCLLRLKGSDKVRGFSRGKSYRYRRLGRKKILDRLRDVLVNTLTDSSIFLRRFIPIKLLFNGFKFLSTKLEYSLAVHFNNSKAMTDYFLKKFYINSKFKSAGSFIRDPNYFFNFNVLGCTSNNSLFDFTFFLRYFFLINNFNVLSTYNLTLPKARFFFNSNSLKPIFSKLNMLKSKFSSLDVIIDMPQLLSFNYLNVKFNSYYFNNTSIKSVKNILKLFIKELKLNAFFKFRNLDSNLNSHNYKKNINKIFKSLLVNTRTRLSGFNLRYFVKLTKNTLLNLKFGSLGRKNFVYGEVVTRFYDIYENQFTLSFIKTYANFDLNLFDLNIFSVTNTLNHNFLLKLFVLKNFFVKSNSFLDFNLFIYYLTKLNFVFKEFNGFLNHVYNIKLFTLNISSTLKNFKLLQVWFKYLNKQSSCLKKSKYMGSYFFKRVLLKSKVSVLNFNHLSYPYYNKLAVSYKFFVANYFSKFLNKFKVFNAVFSNLADLSFYKFKLQKFRKKFSKFLQFKGGLALLSNNINTRSHTWLRLLRNACICNVLGWRSSLNFNLSSLKQPLDLTTTPNFQKLFFNKNYFSNSDSFLNPHSVVARFDQKRHFIELYSLWLKSYLNTKSRLFRFNPIFRLIIRRSNKKKTSRNYKRFKPTNKKNLQVKPLVKFLRKFNRFFNKKNNVFGFFCYTLRLVFLKGSLLNNPLPSLNSLMIKAIGIRGYFFLKRKVIRNFFSRRYYFKRMLAIRPLLNKYNFISLNIKQFNVNYLRGLLNYLVFFANFKKVKNSSQNLFSLRLRLSFYSKLRKIFKLNSFTAVKKLGFVAKRRKFREFNLSKRSNKSSSKRNKFKFIKSPSFFNLNSNLNKRFKKSSHKFFRIRMLKLLLRRKKFFIKILWKRFLFVLSRLNIPYLTKIKFILRRKRYIRSKVKRRILKFIFKSAVILNKLVSSQVNAVFDFKKRFLKFTNFFKKSNKMLLTFNTTTVNYIKFRYRFLLYSKFYHYKNQIKLNFFNSKKFNFIWFIMLSYFNQLSSFFLKFLQLSSLSFNYSDSFDVLFKNFFFFFCDNTRDHHLYSSVSELDFESIEVLPYYTYNTYTLLECYDNSSFLKYSSLSFTYSKDYGLITFLRSFGDNFNRNSKLFLSNSFYDFSLFYVNTLNKFIITKKFSTKKNLGWKFFLIRSKLDVNLDTFKTIHYFTKIKDKKKIKFTNKQKFYKKKIIMRGKRKVTALKQARDANRFKKKNIHLRKNNLANLFRFTSADDFSIKRKLTGLFSFNRKKIRKSGLYSKVKHTRQSHIYREF